MCESNLLETGETPLALVGMVQSRIDKRGLQSRSSVIAPVPSGDDVFQLVYLFLLLNVGTKGDETLEVHAVPVASVLPYSVDDAEISLVQVSPGSLQVPKRDREDGVCYLKAGESFPFCSKPIVECAADSWDLGGSELSNPSITTTSGAISLDSKTLRKAFPHATDKFLSTTTGGPLIFRLLLMAMDISTDKGAPRHPDKG